MIVQCEHCQTKYRIADEKVKGKGVKVRCAKCENVFTVTPEENGAQPPVEDAQATPPEETQDPSYPDSPDEGPGGAELPTPPSGEELPPLSKEEAPGLAPLPPLDGTQDGSVHDEGQPTGPDTFDTQPPADLGPPSLEDGSVDSGSQRPAHEMDQDGFLSPPSSVPEPSDDGGFEIEGTLREDDVAGSDSFGASDPGAAALPAEPDPESGWGNIAIGDQGTQSQAGEDFGLSDDPGYTPPPPVPVEEPVDQQLPDPMGDPLPETSTISSYEPEAKSGGGKKALFTLLLLAALGAGGYFAYPTVMERIQSRGQETQGTLTPANIQVKALTRADGRIIYSVRGEVRNESAGNVGMVQVEAQFRNVSGDVLSRATSYCGNLFEDRDLANMALDRIQADLQNELGQSLTNASIPPGQNVPFLVVLDNPPSGVSKVTVTILGFKETT